MLLPELTATASLYSSKNRYRVYSSWATLALGLVLANVDCSSSPDGVYYNTGVCTNYINCRNGLRYQIPCPTGDHFNPEKKRPAGCEDNIPYCNCDPPGVAKCPWA